MIKTTPKYTFAFLPCRLTAIGFCWLTHSPTLCAQQNASAKSAIIFFNLSAALNLVCSRQNPRLLKHPNNVSISHRLA